MITGALTIGAVTDGGFIVYDATRQLTGGVAEILRAGTLPECLGYIQEKLSPQPVGNGAGLVRDELTRSGWRPATPEEAADLKTFPYGENWERGKERSRLEYERWLAAPVRTPYTSDREAEMGLAWMRSAMDATATAIEDMTTTVKGRDFDVLRSIASRLRSMSKGAVPIRATTK